MWTAMLLLLAASLSANQAVTGTCAASQCKNGAACVTGDANTYSCNCKPGWEGPLCGINHDDCAPNPCQHGGVCTDALNAFACQCPAGYSGGKCEIEANPCDGSPCKNGAQCTKLTPTDHSCACPAGWTGKKCDVDVVDCTPTSCWNGGTCVDLLNDFRCTCAAGWTGATCAVDVDECLVAGFCHNGTCANQPGGFTCSCQPGYTGDKCQLDINECEPLPCENGATCNNLLNKYTCTCKSGFTGTNCSTNIDDCVGHSCSNGATCVDGINKYTCQCAAGWKNFYCTQDINECTELQPCMNGATCNNTIGDYKCQCVPGYTGKDCETEIDECEPLPCINGGTCTDLLNAYKCSCPPGWTGTRCHTDINECPHFGLFTFSLSDPCIHGDCTNLPGTYSCACHTGYTGFNCDIDIDECEPQPCMNNATCKDRIGYFLCVCPSGLQGAICDTDILECSYLIPVCRHGDCTELFGSYECTCDPGWQGRNCETDIDECDAQPCQNGAACWNMPTPTVYRCLCKPGWTGQNCDIDMDECLEFEPCENNATCDASLLFNDYSCTCQTGWTGKNCSENIDDCKAVRINEVTNKPEVYDPCQTVDKNATCNDLLNDFSCTCGPEWTDALCNLNLKVYQILETVFADTFNPDETKKFMNELVAKPSLVKDLVPFLIGQYDKATRAEMSWDVRDVFDWVAYEEEELQLDVDLTLMHDVTLGNCFTFNVLNASTAYAARMSGREGGLTLEARLHRDEYLYWVDTVAIQIFVHSPLDSITAESPRVSAENAADVELHVETSQFSRLGGVYGRCVNTKTEVKSYYYDGEYTTDGCLRSCVQDALERECGCMDPRYPMPAHAVTCNMHSRGCIDDVVESKGDPSKWKDCDCPQACTSKQYAVYWASTTLPNQPVVCSKYNGSDAEDCREEKNDIVRITISLPMVTTKIFEEKPAMDINQLISSLGGLLGVLMGFSIWTFIEFVYILLEITSILLGFK